MKVTRCPRTLCAALCATLATTPATALINPKYTPVDLVRQSELICRLSLGAPGANAALDVTVVEVLQGKAPAKLVLRLGPGLRAAAKLGRGDLPYRKAGKTAALLFAGDFSAASDGGAGGAGPPVGLLHTDVAASAEAARWFGLFRGAGGALVVAADELDMRSVWAGGNEMLLRAVRYTRADPRAEMPTAVGVRWDGEAKVAHVAGTVHGAAAVDLAGKGRCHLFVLSDAGDRLLRAGADGATFENVTARRKLTTKSTRAAWGDFNGDGRLDLASWNGKALDVALGGADGTFQVKQGAGGFGQVAIGLASLNPAGVKAASLLVSTPAEPVLMTLGTDGRFARKPLPKAAAGSAPLGRAGPCAVADFDNDARPDVLQPFASGALLYKAAAAGAFEPPRLACRALLGAPITAALPGDFDADGLVDVLVTTRLGCLVLRNLGGGAFREVLDEAGEVEYNAKPRVAGAVLWDVNNDGRQEFALLYGHLPPQFYFNRGFACFGYAVAMALRDTRLKARESTGAGQRGGAAADFNGDGATDLALVSADGDVWVLFREAVEGPRLGLTVALPSGAPGPVNVAAVDGKRSLGVRVLAPGGTALFGKCAKGPLLLTWRPGGGARRTKRLTVLKPTRWLLPGEGP